MGRDRTEDEALQQLALRLHAVLLTYTMGSGSMDKTYREFAREGRRADPHMLELASLAMKAWGRVVEKRFAFLNQAPDPPTEPDRNSSN